MGNPIHASALRGAPIVVNDSLVHRFKKYVSETKNENGCLLWIGGTRAGYGAIQHDKRIIGAHVAAFAIAGGTMLPGHVIAHKCDVRSCVNPEHLECVTYSKNNKDGHLRRPIPTPRGEEMAQSVLDEETVVKIRRMYVPGKFSYSRIGEVLGINKHTVRSVIMGHTWAHVAAS